MQGKVCRFLHLVHGHTVGSRMFSGSHKVHLARGHCYTAVHQLPCEKHTLVHRHPFESCSGTSQAFMAFHPVTFHQFSMAALFPVISSRKPFLCFCHLFKVTL